MINMRKKPMSKKEKLRLKHEDKIESERYKALDDVCRMHLPEARFHTVRDIAEHYMHSHTWLYNLIKKCLVPHIELQIIGYEVVKGRERAQYRKVRAYEMRHDVRTLIKREKRGPEEGYLMPKTEQAVAAIVEAKNDHSTLGAAKINKIAG